MPITVHDVDHQGNSLPDLHFMVLSGDNVYYVSLTAMTCDCPDHEWRGTLCKHIRACQARHP